MERIDKGTLLVGGGGRESGRRREYGFISSLTIFTAILNIHMHKKDSRKALMLQKWIAFCYEMHVSISVFLSLFYLSLTH